MRGLVWVGEGLGFGETHAEGGQVVVQEGAVCGGEGGGERGGEEGGEVAVLGK